MARAWTFVKTCLALSHAPRVIRRTTVACPADHRPTSIDVLLDGSGRPAAVLRCALHPEHPPDCPHGCLAMPETMHGPAAAVIVCPPGDGAPEEPEID